MLFLYLYFRKSSDPKTRSWSLGFMLLSSIFLWLFIGLSLVLCYALSETYEYQLEVGIRAVFGRGVLISVVAALPLAAILREFSPKIILTKVTGRHRPSKEVISEFNSIAHKMEVPSAELILSEDTAPVSFAFQTDRPMVVMSERLLSLLNNDELEAVMAHELAHIRNSDTTLKALVTAYRLALPIDPVVRLVEAAFHREREIVADETAVKTTKKPLSLASALLKIHEAFPKSKLGEYGTLSILGAGTTLLSRHPPMRQRVTQLIHLSENHQ
jgi:Zn-dependent protease with chaperone function